MKMNEVYTDILVPMKQADFYFVELQRDFPLRSDEKLVLRRRIGYTNTSAVTVCGSLPLSLEQRRFIAACGLRIG